MNLFTRTLGSETGIQLNPLQDNSSIPVNADNSDQNIATMARLPRGRYDKPFLLNRANLVAKLGKRGSRISAVWLNEARVHLQEALSNGAANAVVQRLVREPLTVHKWIYASSSTSISLAPVIGDGAVTAVTIATKGNQYQRPQVTIAAGTGATIIVKVNTNGVVTGVRVWGGSGYNADSVITISEYSGITNGGAGAKAELIWPRNKADSSLDGVTVAILSGGSGYSHPTVTVAEDAANPATAVATLSGISGGSLTDAVVTMTKQGLWYDADNTLIDIVDASGASVGAGETISLLDENGNSLIQDGKITGIKVSGGSGYSNSNLIKITRKVLFDVEMENSSGALQTLAPSNGSTGANFAVGAAVTLSGTRSTATNPISTVAHVSAIEDGVIISLTPQQGDGETLNGSANVTVAISAPTDGGKQAKAYATVANGLISRVVMVQRGSKYSAATTTATIDQANNPEFVADVLAPGVYAEPYLFALKHLEAFNDGIILALHANPKVVKGVAQANDEITLRLIDPFDRSVLYQFVGSLQENATDDFGNSTYLPDVVASQTDAVQLVVGANTSISPLSSAYGYDTNGQEQWVSSVDPVLYFFEGGINAFAYNSNDLYNARRKLQDTVLQYGTIVACGSTDANLLSELANLAYETNTPFKFDVPFVVGGANSVLDAISFVDNLDFTAKDAAHLLHAYWTPITCDDPIGVNGRLALGSAALNAAYTCRRNAVKNSKGFAKKNAPVAGSNWPLSRRGMRQEYAPSREELSALADARINPVLFESFASGGKYVFVDFLTQAPVTNSLRKLTSVSEMSVAIDAAIARFGKDVLALPMQDAVTEMGDYLKALFEGAEQAKWLVPSAELGGRTFAYTVAANPQRPYDVMDIAYSLSYDGAVRQITITQSLVKR
ncbi:hypothetical protein [Methylovulum psychrotolerans]|uniref:Uncharacterized protein n=1 Tax=Methylovulum psychrotolerans TaxID=1704499 RepID=A0A1Z4C3S5_9GAMM|nr:hypothetical protein [Methylovulum psychrotolerans]ASF48158.1 hypothetical protein CEK71_19980 [Methylovulum psychrotolerans]